MRLFCEQCNSTVEVNPPLFYCPHCDADLRAQVTSEAGPVFLPEDEARYFYDRAVELALAKNDDEALATIDRGLARLDTSELHLLAALIHRKRKEYEQMRRHVAAIPVDDSLRREAEWLLRSHQEQQRMLRQTAQKSKRKSARLQPTGLLNSEDRYMIDEFNNHPSRRKREHTWLWALPTVVLLAILVFWQAPLIERWLGISLLDLDTFVLPGVEPDGVVEIPAEDEQSTQLLEDTAEPSVATPEQIPTLEPTPLPTATPPPNIVEAQSPSPQPIAASGTVESLIVVSTVEQPVFDIAPYLELFGRADLSELDLNARRQNGTLVLEGVVTSTQQRSDLLDLAGRVPGVEEVNGIDLLIRLPETYVVEQADTLWSIAFELYGDGARWTEIFDANRDRLSNGSLLSPGQELIVPPLQGNP